MKKSINVHIGGDEFRCTEFYDVDMGAGGVEVFEATTDRYIGSVMDICVPDDHECDAELEIFEQAIESMLIDEYF
jgi:hypothetical protein